MTQDELKALIEDLRLNHEYCPKEVILQAADELERLAQPEQEPHGWYIDGYGAVIGTAEPKSVRVGEWLPWYTTPPQRTEPVIDQSAAKRIATALGWTPPRTWVGMTEQERNDMEDFCEMIIGKAAFDAIEARLKQKNGYTEEKNT